MSRLAALSLLAAPLLLAAIALPHSLSIPLAAQVDSLARSPQQVHLILLTTALPRQRPQLQEVLFILPRPLRSLSALRKSQAALFAPRLPSTQSLHRALSPSSRRAVTQSSHRITFLLPRCQQTAHKRRLPWQRLQLPEVLLTPQRRLRLPSALQKSQAVLSALRSPSTQSPRRPVFPLSPQAVFLVAHRITLLLPQCQ